MFLVKELRQYEKKNQELIHEFENMFVSTHTQVF